MKRNNTVNPEFDTLDFWKGVDLDELQYHRAKLCVRLEMKKTELKSRFLPENSEQQEARGKLPKLAKLILGGKSKSLLSAFTYLDLAIISFKVSRKLAKLMKR